MELPLVRFAYLCRKLNIYTNTSMCVEKLKHPDKIVNSKHRFPPTAEASTHIMLCQGFALCIFAPRTVSLLTNSHRVHFSFFSVSHHIGFAYHHVHWLLQICAYIHVNYYMFVPSSSSANLSTQSTAKYAIINWESSMYTSIIYILYLWVNFLFGTDMLFAWPTPNVCWRCVVRRLTRQTQMNKRTKKVFQSDNIQSKSEGKHADNKNKYGGGKMKLGLRRE